MKLEHAKLKVATLIAFTVFCLLIFLYLFQDAGGKVPFSSSYTVKAVVPDTINLIAQSDVRAAGVKVGEVDNVQPDGPNALVTFSIDTKTASFPPLYKNATVQVLTKTLVGESYLAITPGTPSAGVLKDGQTLGVGQNISSVTLQQVLGMLDPATRASVQKDLAGLGNGLSGHGAQLNAVFASLPPFVNNGGAVFSALLPEKQKVASVIHDTGLVMQALGERTSQYQTLVSDAKSTAVAVASRVGEFKAMLQVLPSTLSQARTTVGRLETFSHTATPVFSNLRVASGDLTPAVQQLGPTAADARVLVNRLHPFLNEIRPLFAQLKPAATRLQSVVLPLDANLRQADPALSYLDPFYREFGDFFTNVGSVYDAIDPLGYVARADAVISPDALDQLNSVEQTALNKLTGAAGLAPTLLNAYPEPGTAGDPNGVDARHNVPAAAAVR